MHKILIKNFYSKKKRNKYLGENNRLNKEMDDLSKMNNERMKETIKN